MRLRAASALALFALALAAATAGCAAADTSGFEVAERHAGFALPAPRPGGAPARAPAGGAGEADGEALAKQLSNPIASLVRVPFQLNYDRDIGPGDGGERYSLNVQPVMPFALNDDWNLISRTVIPFVTQDEVAPGAGRQTGVGDTVQSFFFSPSGDGLTWGVGPVFLIPTATETRLGAKKWGLGPTGVLLEQRGPWTFGVLGNHVWSFAGAGDRPEVSASLLQPLLAYTTPGAVTYGLNSESTYDWKAEAWSVPVNAFITKVIRFGGERVNVGAGLRYWAASPKSGPEGLGLRLIFTPFFFR